MDFLDLICAKWSSSTEAATWWQLLSWLITFPQIQPAEQKQPQMNFKSLLFTQRAMQGQHTVNSPTSLVP